MSASPANHPAGAPMTGEQNAEIKAELGYSDERIARAQGRQD